MITSDYRALSLWHDTADDQFTPRPSLPGAADYDVVIVGAGYTGLWTAYYLSRNDPGLRVAVLESEVAGFGASGRNGGWCSALIPTSRDRLAAGSSRDGVRRFQQAMFDTVAEVGAVVQTEGIDAEYARGGTVSMARSQVQLGRARAKVADARAWGLTSDDLVLLDEAAARNYLDAADVLGGTYTPHCAAVHPARLVRGLAAVVERRGVHVFEHTRVHSIDPWAVHTDAGIVRAEVIVRATEGYTPGLPGHDRAIAPVYSLMVATEPLPDQTWQQLGLAERTTFNDGRHLIVYGQRTADGRIAFGGRGAPYHFASRVEPGFDRDPDVFAGLRSTLLALLPQLEGVAFTHSWGGPLAIARDWWPSVGLDRGTGLAWAGGYVGDGVGSSNLAGRTLADLILGCDSELTTLPWVNHRSPEWEPEPLRWIGINAGLRAMTLADAEESRTGRRSVIARAVAPLLPFP